MDNHLNPNQTVAERTLPASSMKPANTESTRGVESNSPLVFADESKWKQGGRRTAVAQGAPRGALQPSPATAVAAIAYEPSTPPHAGSRWWRHHLFRTLGFGNGVDLTTGKPGVK